RAREEVMDLQAVRAIASTEPAMTIAQHDRSPELRRQPREPGSDAERNAVVVDEHRFDVGVGAELFDDRIRQRHTGHGGGPEPWDLDDEERLLLRRGRRLAVARRLVLRT